MMLILRPTVSRPVSLSAGHPFAAHEQILIVFVWQSLCFFFVYGALSDERTDL
jgi:hypothetical protein